jgi:hypothetical protein
VDPFDVAGGTLKAIAGQVPIIGPVVSGLFEARQGQLRESRLAEFLEDLRDQATAFLEEQFDKGYLESQDYLHLVILACDHARRTRQREKRSLYARALLNAGTREWVRRCDLAEELLNALAELSPVEIRILQAAWEDRVKAVSEDLPQLALLDRVHTEKLPTGLADLHMSEVDIGVYLGRLQRLGFTETITGSLGSTTSYRLTSLFDRLMELIRLRPA